MPPASRPALRRDERPHDPRCNHEGEDLMRRQSPALRGLLLGLLAALGAVGPAGVGRAADHNDPNAINSIFADIPVSAADLYDMFGFPAADKTGGDKVVLAL